MEKVYNLGARTIFIDISDSSDINDLESFTNKRTQFSMLTEVTHNILSIL